MHRNRRVTRGLVLAVLISAGLLAQPAAVSADDVQAPVSATDARALREWAGLDARSSTITKSLTGSGAGYAVGDYGVPLSAAEEAVVDDIVATQSRLDEAIAVATRTAGYVSSYLVGTQLNVLTSAQPASMETRVAAHLPPGAALRVIASEYTLADLSAAEREVHALALELPGITRIDGDDTLGVVTVGVDSLQGDTAKHLTTRFGRIVQLEQFSGGQLLACTVNDCGTMGGLTALAGNGTKCTTSFITTWGSSSHRMLTAGHCIKNSGGVGSGAVWKNGVRTITWGMNTAQNFCNGCTTDSGLFIIQTLPADRDQYLLGSGPRDVFNDFLNTSLVRGKLICASRASSGYGCGSITRTNVTVDVDPGPAVFQIKNSWETDMNSKGGDSGAGMIGFDSSDNLWAAGVLFGGPPTLTETWFSSAQNVQAFWGITICVTNAC